VLQCFPQSPNREQRCVGIVMCLSGVKAVFGCMGMEGDGIFSYSILNNKGFNSLQSPKSIPN
jgi:hypothetical protein